MKQYVRSKKGLPRKKSGSSSFPIINKDAAGIDIGSEEHWVAVPEDRDDEPVRPFGCFTADLQAMARWLKKCGITTVAMESTGVYWIPACQILDAHGFEVVLVNARHVKNVPGRKSDVNDCQWVQRLHTYGLLSASFRPDDQMCVLRSYWRHRENLVRYASTHIQHMQKALTEMNIQLHRVIADINGVTGMRIIRAIIQGERDREKLALMRAHGVKSTPEAIAKALEGDYREEHLFALKQAVELYDFYHRQIEACDREIERYLHTFDTKVDLLRNPLSPPKRRGIKPIKNQSYVDLRTELYRITGVDFTQIPGLDALTVQKIVSEVGLDPQKFLTEKRFVSWLGLCPNNRITGGKIKSTKTKKTANRAAAAFRMGAQSLANSNSGLGGFYRRIRARLGAPQAITATAHKLARIFYRMWITGQSYIDLGSDYYENRYKERVLRNITKRARQLGYEATLQPLAQLGVA
jgi:transposase